MALNITLSRTYRWQTENENDQANFVEALVRLFRAVSGNAPLQFDGVPALGNSGIVILSACLGLAPTDISTQRQTYREQRANSQDPLLRLSGPLTAFILTYYHRSVTLAVFHPLPHHKYALGYRPALIHQQTLKRRIHRALIGRRKRKYVQGPPPHQATRTSEPAPKGLPKPAQQETSFHNLFYSNH